MKERGRTRVKEREGEGGGRTWERDGVHKEERGKVEGRGKEDGGGEGRGREEGRGG